MLTDGTYVLQASGGLVLSPLPLREGAESVARAACWHNYVHRIGHHLPLLLVHDLGRMIVEGPPGRLRYDTSALRAAGIRMGGPWDELLTTYLELLQRLSETELCRRGVALTLPDELVAAVLARVFEPILSAMGYEAARSWLHLDLPVEESAFAGTSPADLFADMGGAYEEVALRWAADRGYQVATCADRIDLDTLRLVSLFAGDKSLAGAAATLDLFRVLDDPVAADVIHFSLELLPQVFESQKPKGMQHYSIDGIAGVSRRGAVDQVLPTELAYPDEVFLHKLAENELLYYGHEAERSSERRIHKVLIDASASMRGSRSIFARGLALTLIKRLVGLGEDVELRFFDSRTYEAVRVTGSNFRLPYLLCFRSEKGRNYGRVFRSLCEDVERLGREAGRRSAIYVITHGQCHVSRALIERLVATAWVYGIFVLADDDLDLDYTSLLHRYRKVGRKDLTERSQRRDAALSIVEDAVEEAAL